MSDAVGPHLDSSEIRRTMDAFNARMQLIYGPQPSVEVRDKPRPGIDAFRREAGAAARADIEKIQATYRRLSADLDAIDVGLHARPPPRIDLGLPDPLAQGFR